MTDINQQAFFELVRAGLWEKEARLSQYGNIDFLTILRLAEEQSVVGLVTAGLEHVQDIIVPKDIILQFVGRSLQLEQQNRAMNKYVASLIDDLRRWNVYSLLVKGQGVAQCYERPLWRASGDVDLYLSMENFIKARENLRALAQKVEPDNDITEHINMVMKDGGWVVELHANQHVELSFKIDRGLDNVHSSIFNGGDVRSWINGTTTIFLPSADNDAIIIFTHFLKHFYKGGLGLRQICDWCRLLWTYRDKIDVRVLELRLRKMGLINEWRAFASFAVVTLGMKKEAMPLYDPSHRWENKASYIESFVLESGNFGHNRDMSYYSSDCRLKRKIGSFGRKLNDLIRHARIFPGNTIRFIPCILFNGLREAARGE